MRALLAAAALVAATPGIHHTAAGMAAAKHALVQRADLGAGWSVGVTPKKTGSLACKAPTSLKGIVETGAAISPTYRAGATGPFISASAFAYNSAASAAQYFVRVAKPQALPCLVRTLEAEQPSTGVTFTIVKRQTLRPPSVPANAAAYRVVGRESVSAQKVTVYTDIVLLQRGSAIVELTIASFSSPLPATTENRTVRAAAARL